MPTSNSWFTIIAIQQKNTEHFQGVAIVAFYILQKVTTNEVVKKTHFTAGTT